MRLNRLALVVVILSLISNQVPRVTANPPVSRSARSNNPSPTLSEESKAVWRQFRNTFPLHIQTLAFDKQSRTLIISEPPPHVTLASLKEALQRYNPTLSPSMHVEQKTVGVDGWVKDIVISLPRMDEGQVHDTFDAIQQHLFHTSYKASVMSLPARKSTGTRHTLDLTVSVAEVRKWLFEEKEPLLSVYGDQTQIADDLVRNKRSGVFFSKQRGLVIWSLNRSQPISNYLVEAREFALDSDIIVGAVNVANHLLIVGRERIVPIDFMPPLRTETISLLASVNDDELQQSYERNHIFAGRFSATEDWAPIYLSDRLIDTEYGSLLNITDQILKRWSDNGLVKYANFDYPDPQTWCFNGSLYEEVGTDSVTYNWNTKGLGYTAEVGGRDFFALNRSGSLPTSYIAGELDKTGFTKPEERGYNCFASWGDPNLARVVQYAALYQIFRRFPIKQDVLPIQPPPPQRDVLTENATRALTAFFTQETELSRQSSSAIRLYGVEGLNALATILAHPRLPAGEYEILERAWARLEGARRDPLLLIQALSALPKPQRVKLFAYMDSVAISRDELLKQLILDASDVDIGRVKNELMAASKRNDDEWIHTASVVVSQGLGRLANTTGGHNLSAEVTRYKASLDVPAGKVRVTRSANGKIIVEVNPIDLSRIAPVVRRTAALSRNTRLTPLQIKQSMEAAIATVSAPRSRPIRSALSMPTDIADTGPRGFDGGNGWKPGGPAVVPEEARSAAKYGDVAVLVDRMPRAEGFEFVITTADGRAVKAYSTPSAVDAIVALGRNAPKGNPKIAFHLKGFSEGEAQALFFNTNHRLKSGSLTGVAERGSAFQSKAADYKLPDVAVGNHTLRQVPEGQFKGLYELQVSFDVPGQAASKPPLRVKLQVFYRNAVSNPTVTGLKTAIRSFFNKPVSSDANMKAIIMDLANELRTANPGAKSVLTISEKDTGGIFILEFQLPPKDDRNIREGNHAG